MRRPETKKNPGPWTGVLPFGGGTGTRTPNPLLAKQVRYQLRHAPVMSLNRFNRTAAARNYPTSSVALLQTAFSFSESCHRL